MAKSKTTPKKVVTEFRNFKELFDGEVTLGQTVKVENIFEEGDFVDAVGTSKGKGFQGVVRDIILPVLEMQLTDNTIDLEHQGQ